MRVVETGNGVRLRIESPRPGRAIDLDPLELETLTWQSHDLFTGLLADPYGPRGLTVDLAGKRALIVGAGSGIGRAVHDAFVAEGAAVGVLERDVAKCDALRRAAPATIVVAGDATVARRQRRAPSRAIVERHGGLDVLVSCVGIFDFYRGIRDLARDELLAGVRRAVPRQRGVDARVGAGGARRARRRAAARSC